MLEPHLILIGCILPIHFADIHFPITLDIVQGQWCSLVKYQFEVMLVPDFDSDCSADYFDLDCRCIVGIHSVNMGHNYCYNYHMYLYCYHSCCFNDFDVH